jgi:hypothetical protein
MEYDSSFTSSDANKYTNFYELTVASFGFFLLNLAYLSTANLQTTIMEENGY